MSTQKPHLKKRMRLVLVAPRIAGNVGQVARSALALGAELHLVRPFGFHLDEKSLKRASVGYWEELRPVVYRDFLDFWEKVEVFEKTSIFWATKGGKSIYSEQHFGDDVMLIFGNEEEGVSNKFWDFKDLPEVVDCKIPTVGVRCLNLAASVAVFGFEVRRQWASEPLLKTGVIASETQATSNAGL